MMFGVMTVPVMHMGGVEDVGRRIGMLFTVISFSVLAGIPLSGALAEQTGGFRNSGFFAGKSDLQSF
jgi:predicted MFS family arabinose efflux permease